MLVFRWPSRARPPRFADRARREAPVPAAPDATALVDAALAATEPASTADADSVIAMVAKIADATVAPVVPEPTVPAAPVAPATVAAAETAPPVVETQEPAPAAPAETPASAAETQADTHGDTTSAAMTAPAIAPPADAIVRQIRPVNVNISIRVESPGDNGPVGQVNAAIGQINTASGTVSPASAARPATDADEQQAASPPPAATPSSAQSPPTSPVDLTEPWDWTWAWDCGSVISPGIVVPGTSSLPIWNWNWNWNCGGDPNTGEENETELPQRYQGDTTQYQPINVNISIRVESPGNDGPVSQANIAQTIVSLAAAALPPSRRFSTLLSAPAECRAVPGSAASPLSAPVLPPGAGPSPGSAGVTLLGACAPTRCGTVPGIGGGTPSAEQPVPSAPAAADSLAEVGRAGYP